MFNQGAQEQPEIFFGFLYFVFSLSFYVLTIHVRRMRSKFFFLLHCFQPILPKKCLIRVLENNQKKSF